MSGEFGTYGGGYFHSRIADDALDLSGGRCEITRKWGRFFKEFAPVARAISWCEACDSDESYPISETLHQMRKMREALDEIEAYLDPFKRVADDAVRKALEAKK